MSIGRPALTSRSEIIEAARHLLQTEGVDALSVRNVASAVNTAASTIYNYFGSKQGLLRELADAMLSEARPQVSQDQDPVDALRQWMYDYRSLLRKTPELIILANLSGPVPSVFAIGHDLVTLLERAGLSPKVPKRQPARASGRSSRALSRCRTLARTGSSAGPSPRRRRRCRSSRPRRARRSAPSAPP